ncbi:MAG: hypothetical protein AB7V77_06005 [Candidatus Woesearchaeota archaeon]
MKTYFVLEIGKSAYTEFKMKDGTFHQTEDCILVDEIKANSKNEAYEKLIKDELHKNKVFNHLLIVEIVDELK